MAGINFGQILGGVGAVAGILGNMNAQRDASRARRDMTAASNQAAEKERLMAAELMKQYNQRMQIAQDAINSGVFDANRLVSRLDQDFMRNQARLQENLASAFRTMGYRPGDSEPGTRLQAAMQQGLNQRNQQAEALRMQAPSMLLQLLGNAEGGLLNRVASMEGAAANRLFNLGANNYNMAQANQSDLGSFIGTLMPFLNQTQNRGGSGSMSSIQGMMPSLVNSSMMPLASGNKKRYPKPSLALMTPNQGNQRNA